MVAQKAVWFKLLTIALCSILAPCYSAVEESVPVFGPVNAAAQGSGCGIIQWFNGNPPTEPKSAWTISAWVQSSVEIAAPVLVAGFGDGLDYIGAQRFLAVDAEGWFVWYGGFAYEGNKPTYSKDRLMTNITAEAGVWQHLAATYDGRILTLYINGKLIAQEKVSMTRAAMQVNIAPPPAWKQGACYNGRIAGFTVRDECLDLENILRTMPDKSGLDSLEYQMAPVGLTPAQYSEPEAFQGRRNLPEQSSDSLPQPVPVVHTQRVDKMNPRSMSKIRDDGTLLLDAGWEMLDAAEVEGAGEQIATYGYDSSNWYDATVPGTALTTLVNQGVYPDPAHGLNNCLIPDLATKSWWYRVEFAAAEQWQSKEIELLFKGINYRAVVWLNGKNIGEICGAFIRGQFDITALLSKSEKNVLAVRVWPQPHYSKGAGESSVKFGPGSNGADALLDGPTFFCTEGWDWNPTTRDRCTGIWQDVIIQPVGSVMVKDPQVITRLPQLPELDIAEVTVKADLQNVSGYPRSVTVNAEIADIHCSRKVSLAAGETKTVTFSPDEFAQLSIKHPRLWWPVGYGNHELYELKLSVLDSNGTKSSSLVRKAGLRQLDYGYLPKDTPGADNSPFYIKINGRNIFVRGGNWGLDEMMKRSSTDKLEPYFRLHRDANLNMIRNWCGQSTQENFYELADKYGLMVWNDFWMSTANSNQPPLNEGVFMANVNDTIKRYRQHASIVVWCGRNEGAPPEWLNGRIADAVKELDGTRIYIPSSRGGHLTGSGPWTFKEHKWYFSDRAKGFATELGINSIPTLDALKDMLDPGQYWPWQGNDAWAYHDYPSMRHGEVKAYREAAEKRYGRADNLEDFVKCMQMQNYTHHRAMYESFNAYMWKPATGLLIWMSHPAWPSMVWQLYTSDYDTQASYYGAKKACQPVHVQWNLDDNAVAVINTTYKSIPQATVKAQLFDLNGRMLSEKSKTIDAGASIEMEPFKVDWADYNQYPVQFLKLILFDGDGNQISDNFYWTCEQGKPENLLALRDIPQVNLDGKVSFSRNGKESAATVQLANQTDHPALMAHLVLRDAATGKRILPSYASDNYVSLLPGETKVVTISCMIKDSAEKMCVTLDGWNIANEGDLSE